MAKLKRLLSFITYRVRVYLASKILGEKIYTDYQDVRHSIINSAVAIKGMVYKCRKCSMIRYNEIDKRCGEISEQAAKLK